MASAALDVETFEPDDGTEGEIVDFMEALRSRGMDVAEPRAHLVSRDGRESIPLPDELFRVLKTAACSLADGRAVSLASIETQMTTMEAAEFLGMSRPTLIKIVDRGDIPCTKIGRHRRIRLGDLLDYQRRRAAIRSEALDQMVDIAIEERLYDATAQSGEGIR